MTLNTSKLPFKFPTENPTLIPDLICMICENPVTKLYDHITFGTNYLFPYFTL